MLSLKAALWILELVEKQMHNTGSGFVLCTELTVHFKIADGSYG